MCLSIPGKVLSIETDALGPVGKVDFGGAIQSVRLDLVPETAVGDYVIVHVGFALNRLDTEEADRVLTLLHEMTEKAAEAES